MPNVVVIHTDDTGRHIGPYGYDVETPRLSELADEGVSFRNAYSAAPTCSPSRAAVMTGQTPHSCGMLGLAHRGFALEHPEHHLATFLSGHGCDAVLAGQQHEAHLPDGTRHQAARDVLGYDRTLSGDPSAHDPGFDHDGSRRDLANAAAAADFLRDRDANGDPFFLSVGLYNTHKPFPLGQNRIEPGRVAAPPNLPDVPPVREELAAYTVLAETVDECVGRVLSGVDDGGHRSDTLVVFTTDHGLPLPRMKCDLRDGGIGVSLLARFPAGYQGGGTVDALVSTRDLFPTVCDVMDVPVPRRVDAPSLVPLVTGAADSIHDAVFSEVTYHAAYEPKRAVRTDRYKYIRRFDEEYTREVGPNTDDGPSKRFLMERGFLERERPREALYDIVHDPQERDNLADDPGHRTVRDEMADRLADWMTRTNDPLLDGPVPKPEGARIDRRSGDHPGGEREPASVR